LSFAIPIDVAINVRDQLIETGRVTRGRIGVVVQDVDAQLANSFGLDRPRGALVSEVSGGGPSDEAGLKPGDVILAVNGREFERFNELSRLVSGMKPGSEARLRVWRDGKAREITVKVEELVDTGARAGGPVAGAAAEQLGMTLRPLRSEEKRRFDTEGNIIVEQVTNPAASAGVRSGDIILGVSGQRIENVQALRRAIKDAKGSIALLVQRGPAQVFIPVPLKRP
jgi:serine protease Do